MASERESNLLCEYCGGKMATSDRFCAGCGHANPGFVAPLPSGGSVNAEHLISTQERIKYDEYKLKEVEEFLDDIEEAQRGTESIIYKLYDALGDVLRQFNLLAAPELDQVRVLLRKRKELANELKNTNLSFSALEERITNGFIVRKMLKFGAIPALWLVIKMIVEQGVSFLGEAIVAFGMGTVIYGGLIMLFYYVGWIKHWRVLHRNILALEGPLREQRHMLDVLDEKSKELEAPIEDSDKILSQGEQRCDEIEEALPEIEKAVEGTSSYIVSERLPKVVKTIRKELPLLRSLYEKLRAERDEIPEYKTYKKYCRQIQKAQTKLVEEWLQK